MIEWVVSSCILILAVIALRYLLRGRISLRLQYALWLLVLARVLIPVSPRSPVPRSRLMKKVSIESSAWWAMAMAV